MTSLMLVMMMSRYCRLFVLVGCLSLLTCAQHVSQSVDPIQKKRITTGSVEFLLGEEFREIPVESKDTARWQFVSGDATLYVELGSNTPEFSNLRKSYEQWNDYEERDVTIDGFTAVSYSFSFQDRHQAGLYMAGTDSRSTVRFTLEGKSPHTRDLADEIFRSIKYRR
jgi:hypothetical protein